MDLTFLYYWDVYYFLQGFLLDVKSLVENANPIVVVLCFAVLVLAFLYIERKRLRPGTVLFAIFAALYGTFMLTVTILGRSNGMTSSIDQLFSIYTRAFSGDKSAQLDILYNIVLYVSVGLFISHYKNTKIDVIVLVMLPTVIELIQLITSRGVFEISDIINNFVGGLIGLGFARLIGIFIRFIKDKRKGGQVERAE